jgi:hypothetical protein
MPPPGPFTSSTGSLRPRICLGEAHVRSVPHIRRHAMIRSMHVRWARIAASVTATPSLFVRIRTAPNNRICRLRESTSRSPDGAGSSSCADCRYEAAHSDTPQRSPCRDSPFFRRSASHRASSHASSFSSLQLVQRRPSSIGSEGAVHDSSLCSPAWPSGSEQTFRITIVLVRLHVPSSSFAITYLVLVHVVQVFATHSARLAFSVCPHQTVRPVNNHPIIIRINLTFHANARDDAFKIHFIHLTASHSRCASYVQRHGRPCP